MINADNPVPRYLQQPLAEALADKIALVTGPRQCGKTTLARMLESDYQYINYDSAEHRQVLRDKSWDRQRALIIFDELHKRHGWKAWLKGICDVEGLPPALLVTGSARLDAFRKTGDSLADQPVRRTPELANAMLQTAETSAATATQHPIMG